MNNCITYVYIYFFIFLRKMSEENFLSDNIKIFIILQFINWSFFLTA